MRDGIEKSKPLSLICSRRTETWSSDALAAEVSVGSINSLPIWIVAMIAGAVRGMALAD